MKSINFCLVLIVVFSNLKGQEIKVEFDNAVPRWFFVFNDTNFIKGSQSQINGQNSIGAITQPFLEGKYGYISCAQVNGEGQYDGGPLCKFRLEDGEIIWNNYFNTSNLDDQNFISYWSLSNELFLSGRKRTQYSKQNESSWSLGGYSLPVVRRIDINNGQIVEEYYDKTDTIGTFDVLIKYALRNFKDKIFQMYRTGSDSLVWVQVEEFSKETGKVKEIQILPYKHLYENEKIEKARWYHFKHSDSVLITLFYHQSRDTTISPDMSGMEIFKLDGDTFKSVKYIDLKPYFKKVPQSTLADMIWINSDKSGNFLLSKTYQLKGENRVKCWLLKMDSAYEISSYTSEVKIDSLNHTYSALLPFYTKNNSIFLVGLPSATDLKGVDLIKVENNLPPKIIGSLQTGTEKSKLINILPAMDDFGNIIITCGWDNQAYVVVGFHISDFGINLSSEDMDFTPPKPLLTVSPNPAADHIILSVKDETYTKGVVSIRDIEGKIVLSQSCQTGEQIDVHHVPSGTYIVLFNPESRPDYFLTTKLVKP